MDLTTIELARIVYHLMRHGESYVTQTEEAYAAQVRERLEKQLHHRDRELGYEVKKGETPPSLAASESSEAGT